MFRAVDALDGGEVVILDTLAGDELEALRQKGQRGNLRCPICSHEVNVRAGDVRVWHFAHKHLENCPSQNEPVELLQARAIVYRWLKQRFPEGVTVEKPLEGVTLPRPIDCLVQAGDNKLAYWIVCRRMKPEHRQQVQDGAAKAGAKLLVIFLSGVMDRHKGCPQHILHLSTTERHFLQMTGYDLLYPAKTRNEGSLHYLDITTETLMTLRAMHCMEYPNFYVGTEIQSHMSNMKVSPASGQFHHGDEYDRFIVLKAERERRQREEAQAQHRVNEARTHDDAENLFVAPPPSPARSSPAVPSDPTPAAIPPWTTRPTYDDDPIEQEREGTCLECGQRTRDWWMFENKTGMCRCNDCARKRRAKNSSQ